MAATNETTSTDDNNNTDDNTIEALFSSSTCPLLPIAVAFQRVRPHAAEMETIPLLEAFDGICVFLDSLGIAPLSFVRKDIVLKITTIKALFPPDERDWPASPHYRIHSGFEHECTAGVHLQKSAMVWNLVRLKRALVFVTEFIRGLNDPSRPVSDCCSAAYTTTFETLHPWTIRKLVSVAVYALPGRSAFLQRLQINGEDEAAVLIRHASVTLDPVLAALTSVFEHFSLGHLR